MTSGMQFFRTASLVALVRALSPIIAVAQVPAEAVDPTGASQDNVVIVLDASGSMNEYLRGNSSLTRMQAAKQALLAIVDNEQALPPTTNVGLLVFSSSNLTTEWPYPLGKVDRAALRAAVQSPEAGGGTPLGAYLKIGADRLLAQREKQHGYGTYRLLVVSDGEANDPELVEQFLPDILGRGLTVDVIGVDMLEDHALATRVHSYQRADDPQALFQAVSRVFAEVGGDQQAVADEQEIFDVIQPLPEEMAKAMVAALSRTGNHPIGERPTNVDEAAAGTGSTASGQGPGAAPSQGTSWTSFVIGSLCIVVIVGIVGLLLFVGVLRALLRQGGRT
jgi:hypothetical protein